MDVWEALAAQLAVILVAVKCLVEHLQAVLILEVRKQPHFPCSGDNIHESCKTHSYVED